MIDRKENATGTQVERLRNASVIRTAEQREGDRAMRVKGRKGGSVSVGGGVCKGEEEEGETGFYNGAAVIPVSE